MDNETTELTGGPLTQYGALWVMVTSPATGLYVMTTLCMNTSPLLMCHRPRITIRSRNDPQSKPISWHVRALIHSPRCAHRVPIGVFSGGDDLVAWINAERRPPNDHSERRSRSIAVDEINAGGLIQDRRRAELRIIRCRYRSRYPIKRAAGIKEGVVAFGDNRIAAGKRVGIDVDTVPLEFCVGCIRWDEYAIRVGGIGLQRHCYRHGQNGNRSNASKGEKSQVRYEWIGRLFYERRPVERNRKDYTFVRNDAQMGGMHIRGFLSFFCSTADKKKGL